ncbi:D-alanyl-D-alanine carboxypeptidase [Labilithrix luteola]|uniref:D-alanyl-D-alanine carboxypeptidase n=1 Tax=Labilithrix luteola TaxID=1391654 RepID=A0A0K1PZW4_9BACT|nr:D-alanyl-D-alanine carboxypeptidase [Labilithrix luteola]
MLTLHWTRCASSKLAVLFALTASVSACTSETHHFDEATLDADLKAAQKTANVVGLLAEVQTPDGNVRARAGVAELGSNDPVPWDAVFRVASTTKTFTSVVVLQLVGEGKLSLEDSVDKWLPGVVSGNGNDGAKITIRQLLQHTSGLFDYVMDSELQQAYVEDFERVCQDATPPEGLVAYGLKHAPLFEPGTRWAYSNTNYVLLEMAIQKITGRSWADEVRQRIIGRLGLLHTYAMGFDPKLPGPHAHSYFMIPNVPPIDATECSTMHTADSALISSTADLNAFFKALVRGELLRPQELAEMQKTVEAPDDQFPNGRYGLGLQWTPLSCGGGYWHHAGDSPTGFHTRTGVTADGRRSVVISMSSTVDFLKTNAATAALTDHALCDAQE